KNAGDWNEDGAVNVVAGSVGGLASGSAAASDIDLDVGDSFDEARFEAELVRDMEFAEHDAQARTDAVSADLQSEYNDADDDAPTAERSQFGLKLAAIVGSIAIVGAVGLFMFGGGGADETAGPVVVEADPEPIKIRPENPGGTEVPNQDRAVFADTNQASEPSQPSLVATSEEPVDLAGLPDADAAKSEERLLPEVRTVDGPTAAPAEDNAITPRRVRTLVVRPDGTLEERPLPEPEPEIEVAAAPAQPEVDVVIGAPATPASEPAGAPESAATGTGPVDFQPPAGGETSTGLTDAETAALTTGTAAVPAAEDVPVRRVQTQVFSPNGIPDRPANQPVNIVNPQPAPQQTAAAPQPAPQPVAAPAAPASEFKVQIASLPTQEAAQQTSANLLSQFRNVLGGRGVAIREAQIPNRGTFYRVQVDATSLDDANNLCARYRSAGGDCIVTR
ncbi:MAG: SPOR domain-containing protein, partial [Pseudomonadota bacterium]